MDAIEKTCSDLYAGLPEQVRNCVEQNSPQSQTEFDAFLIVMVGLTIVAVVALILNKINTSNS